MIEIDGSIGEGGGQILRSALALSLVTGQAFAIRNIRAGRERPGLMRQHLTAVSAATSVGEADVEGAAMGSTSLTFRPRRVRGGAHDFAVGTAGSATLVLHTVLPALACATEPSTLTLEGGTHNPAAPPFEHLARSLAPVLRAMGPIVELELDRRGFYPAGAGRFRATITPITRWQPIEIETRGATLAKSARAIVAHLPVDIAAREIAVLSRRLHWDDAAFETEVDRDSVGPGNAVIVEVVSEALTEVFAGFGEKRVRAERVAECVADEVRAYLVGEAPVGPHLADQLIVPLALAGGGSFVTSAPTAHTRTQLLTVEKFLGPVVAIDEFAPGRWRVRASVSGSKAPH